MKKFGFTLWIVLLGMISFAQPKIQFEKTTHDFGTIKEEGGRQTGRFEFTNVGDSALVLTQVKASCGCTATDYTRTPIAPGEKGFIDAAYNPSGRPGGINKNVRVTTNEPKFQGESKASPYVLYLKGNVEKRPPTIFEQAGYKIGTGMMRVKDPNIKFTIKNTETHLDTITVKNFWTKPITVEYEKLPEYITEVYRSFKGEIQPDKEEIIVFKYDATKKNDFGTINEHIILKTTDSLDAKKAVSFNATIREDFAKVNLAKAPKATIESNTIDMGEVTVNQNKETEITIKNEGRNPLIIRKIASSHRDMTTTVTTITIDSGKSETISLKYYPRRVGNAKGTVEFITNDPANDVIVVNYSAKVIK
ncbi:DUF1573 domain-containing protein [Bacteroidales bacterium OttesenSCG-928-B11]|nr:DUF1573 domain-containing protein [Bacteroidales bacterium OttesenSCG-928-E04]MDL2311352.1 DUF1573 domain-containing protein [Bacteroidales bacterium OttesenSCG-928-B11]